MLSCISATLLAPCLVIHFSAAMACWEPVPLIRKTCLSFWSTSSWELAAGMIIGMFALPKIGRVGSVAPEQ